MSKSKNAQKEQCKRNRTGISSFHVQKMWCMPFLIRVVLLYTPARQIDPTTSGHGIIVCYRKYHLGTSGSSCFGANVNCIIDRKPGGA